MRQVSLWTGRSYAEELLRNIIIIKFLSNVIKGTPYAQLNFGKLVHFNRPDYNNYWIVT